MQTAGRNRMMLIAGLFAAHTTAAGGLPQASRAEPVKPHNSIGRNKACPCGSGAKYKKCCKNTRSVHERK